MVQCRRLDLSRHPWSGTRWESNSSRGILIPRLQPLDHRPMNFSNKILLNRPFKDTTNEHLQFRCKKSSHLHSQCDLQPIKIKHQSARSVERPGVWTVSGMNRYSLPVSRRMKRWCQTTAFESLKDAKKKQLKICFRR